MAAMTQTEYSAAVRRAHTEYGQEMSAATAEYNEGRKRGEERRELAAVRKRRGTAAKTARDTRIAELREQFAKERQAEAVPQ